jgi:hypothetical protein
MWLSAMPSTVMSPAAQASWSFGPSRFTDTSRAALTTAAPSVTSGSTM